MQKGKIIFPFFAVFNPDILPPRGGAMTRNIRMTLEYDGSNYHGWQRQKNGLSIQQVLEEKIAVMTGEAVRVIGSGRTDAGVHALGQVAHFRTASSIREFNLLGGLNSLLPRDIVIRDLREVDASFHARYDAKSKVYLYQVHNRPVRPALFRQYAWFVPGALDFGMMQEAAHLFEGTHDFSSFCSTHTDSPDRIRTITGVRIGADAGSLVRIEIEADGFLRYMVRGIVGVLVDAGRGKRTLPELRQIMEAKDRRCGGATAPAHGLFLKEVRY
ncbi:MAG: tRNA pseudouridine synthase A [Syntrophaceae bacterium PtaB.Bin095]|jgi:tRNA pseudouridine38-40 synthase|nr:MAG: tRNA pseudouridine synthase A [Syntrophaceae bacterium PtaB.Bin095]